MKRVLIGLLSASLCIGIFSGCSFFSKDKAVESNVVQSEEDVEDSDNDESSEESEVEEKPDSEEQEDVVQAQAEVETPAVKESSETQTPVSKKLVVIDPGHASHSNSEKEKQSPDSDVMKIKDGGGAEGVVTKTPEYVVAMNVSMKLKDLLEKSGKVTVVMTKTSNDQSLGNIDRAEVGNSNNADLEIRIHCDSAESQSAKGASMLVPAKCGYVAGVSDVSRSYGETILKNVVSTAGMNNRGVVERSDMTGFNWSKVPVVLIEMGFMSNPDEDRLLNDDAYQNKLAQGMCNGILEALNK